MAKNKKIPELSLQNTFKTAEKTLKMNTPSKKEKEEVDKKFGTKGIPNDATRLKEGPVTEKRAADIVRERTNPSTASAVPLPSGKGGEVRGADVVIRAGENWREEKRTVSPYSGMSYREMTDDINNTYGGELRRGNIGQLDFYLERGKYDRERIEKAGREELSELLSEKENEYNILFEMPMYSGGNYDVIDSRAKEVKALYDEIQSRINSYDTNEKIKKDYEREFYKYGKEALQGDSAYHPTESLIPTDYDIVNQFANARKENNETLDKLYNTLYNSKKHLAHLNDGEIKLLNSLHSENPEKAEAFLKSIEGTLNKRLSDYETQEAYKYAKEHPYIAGAKSVAENVLGGAAATIDNIAEGITGDVDTYDYTSRVAREGQALRQGGSQYMKENHGKGAEFAYGAGLSMVENLANIALFKGLGKVAGVGKAASGLSAFNMASGAAANSMINIADRGGSDIQILTGGVASGVAEYLFEKFSFDKLFDIKNTKGILNKLKAGAIQVGVEGSEEIFTEAANIISDALIMQGNSENNIRRRQYVMQGMSAEEATKKVFFETVDQIASAGAAGMLSGGIMGGGAIALNNISHNNYINNAGEAIVKNKPALERLIQLGLDEGSADARFAAELISQGESISGKEAGALLETIIGESISKNGGIGNIIKNIYTLQGGDTGYITSKEAVDTARAVQHMAEGKVTDVDRALLQRSPGAVSLLSIVEGNEAAWKSLSGSAAQMQNAKGKMQNEIIKERGTPYTQKELVDEDVYSNGQKVVIPENGRVAKNIVLNDESLRVRREKAKDYKNVETLAEDLEMKVMYVKGLTDSNGDAIGGIVTSKGIIINSDAENISRFVATHEFSHRLKQISPERWNSYQSYVIDKLKTDGNYYDVFERKAAAYQSREDATINEEIAADYIGELFGNETELAEFIRKDVKEASKVRNLWYSILDKLGLLDEKKKAQRLWASAYREGMSNKGKAFEGAKYSKEYSFSKQVDDALNYKMKSGYSVYVGKLPKLLAKCGLNPDLDMLINQGHLRDINHEKDGLHDEYHDIPREIIKQIPELLKRPAAIYDSISEKNKKNSVCLLTTKCDRDGNPIIVIIENSNKGGSYLNLKMETVNVEASNYVKSVYGRKGFLSHMNDVIDKDSVLYASKNGMERLFAEIERFNANNKKPKLNSDSKLQLLTRLDNLGFDTIIHQSRNVVKNNSMQNGNKKSITGTRLSDIENERTAQLEAENAELKKQLENLNLQLNLSPDTGSGLDTQAIKELAKGIKTKAASKVRLSELHQELVKLYSYMGGTAVDGGEVNKRIDSIAEMVLSKSTQTIENEENAELLKRIKEMRIYVPEREREDFRDGFEYFRKHNAMGKITLANDGTDLDVYWDELAEEYPAYFSEDVIGSEERLERILEVREELAPSEESLYNSNEEYEKAKANLRNYIKESYYNIPEGSENNKYVFYDKRTAEVQRELDKAREDVGKQKFRNEKEKIRRKLDSDFNYLRRMVTDPTDKKHLPEDMRASIAYLLDECFQYETKYTDKLKDEGKTEESPKAVKLEKMHEAYSKIIRQSWGVSAKEKSEIVDEFLNEDVQELMDEVPIDESGKFKRIEDMSLHELRVISKVLAAVHHSVTQRNKAFNEAIKEELSQLGTNANADFESKINKKGEKLDQEDKVIQKTLVRVDKFFNLDNVQPGDFFHEIGGTIERLYKEERKAFDKYIEHIREGSKALTEATKNIDLKKLTGKKVKRKWFKLDSGYEIELTKGQMLSMYALYLRNQGKQHLLNGGIETRGNAKNALGEKVGSSNIYRVTEADIGKIFEEITNEERKMVAKVVMFLSQKCAKWGNETSMKLYGYEKFGEEWYFPIKVSRQALNTFSGEKGEGNLSTQGFSKNLVKEAKNPVELNDFFDVVTSHINGMALYNTIALPMLDLERVLNYTDKSNGRNVRNTLMRAFGRNANKYIETFHKDLNGTRKKPKETLASTVASKAKKASIGLNLRVLLQQPTSIARAFLFIDPLDINRKFNIKALTKEMQENIPIAYWKSLGFRDVGTGGNLKQVMLDNESLYDKVAMGSYGLADDLTWAVIYGSVKNEIKRKNKGIDVSSTEFKEKVLERFNYVVDRSQVVDSVFHRTQSMGSESDVVRNLNMFMSEPLKTYNMYRTELIDILRSESKGEKIAKATRATAVFAVSNLLLAAAQALPDAWREDDEKELFNDGVAKNFWKELYVEKLKGAFYDDINPLTYFPYMNYVWSIYQGYSEKRPEFSGISEAISSVKGIWDEEKSVIQKVSRLAGSISALFGFSIRNAYRDLTSITRALYTGFGEEYADYTVNKFRWNVKNESNQGKFIKHYKNAIQNGHPEEAELILSDYMAERFGGDFKNEKMAKVLKETARLYKNADKDEKSKVLYSFPKDEYVLDGQIQEMNGSEYARFVEKTYNSLWDLAYDFVMSKEYKEFSDDDKISSFDELKSYVKNAQIMEDHEEYKLLKGWQSDVYSGEVTYAANALERKNEREYQQEREAYKETFDFNEGKYNEKEIGVIEKVESDAASYYASKEKGKEYNEKTLRHIKVYDEKLSSDMEIEEYAGIRAYAKKEAAMSDGKPSLKKDELKTYLDSTEYSPTVKAALFEAIGNKGWKNPYTGKKIGE